MLDALRRNYFDALARREALVGFSEPCFASMILAGPTPLARLRELPEVLRRIAAGQPGGRV